MLFENINYEVFGLNTININSLRDTLIFGNAFISEYKPYKDYVPYKIVAKGEKEEMQLKIYGYDAILNDLNLYLDLNSNKKEVYDLFKKYTLEYKKIVDLYEEKYGPLCLIDSDYDKYEWINNPWPCEGTSDMYV